MREARAATWEQERAVLRVAGGRGLGQPRAVCRQGQRGCLAAAPRQFQAFSASLRSRSPRGTDASHRPSKTRLLLPR